MTRQIASDRTISDARSRLEATLGAAEIGTWVWDLGTNRVFADRNLAAMFGLSAAEAAGAPLERLHLPHPRGRPAAVW